MAVVKANAYGHGDAEVAKAALESGASCLAVAILDEAISLRQRGLKAPILVLGAVPPEYVKIAAEYDVTLTGYSVEWLQESCAPPQESFPSFSSESRYGNEQARRKNRRRDSSRDENSGAQPRLKMQRGLHSFCDC